MLLWCNADSDFPFTLRAVAKFEKLQSEPVMENVCLQSQSCALRWNRRHNIYFEVLQFALHFSKFPYGLICNLQLFKDKSTSSKQPTGDHDDLFMTKEIARSFSVQHCTLTSFILTTATFSNNLPTSCRIPTFPYRPVNTRVMILTGILAYINGH